MSQSVTHCHTVTNKYMKNMSHTKVWLYIKKYFVLVSSLENTFNPEKLQVEVWKKPIS